MKAPVIDGKKLLDLCPNTYSVSLRHMVDQDYIEKLYIQALQDPLSARREEAKAALLWLNAYNKSTIGWYFKNDGGVGKTIGITNDERRESNRVRSHILKDALSMSNNVEIMENHKYTSLGCAVEAAEEHKRKTRGKKSKQGVKVAQAVPPTSPAVKTLSPDQLKAFALSRGMTVSEKKVNKLKNLA